MLSTNLRHLEAIRGSVPPSMAGQREGRLDMPAGADLIGPNPYYTLDRLRSAGNDGIRLVKETRAELPKNGGAAT